MTGKPSIPHGLPQERKCPFDPPDDLTALREQQPLSPMIYADGHQGWLITSHALAKTVLADVRFSSAAERLHSPILSAGTEPIPPQPVKPGFFIRMDPPDHTRLRRMLTGVFTVKRMKQLEPRIADIVSEHLDAMERMEPPIDLVEVFALPIPSLVICELLGVPYADREVFQQDTSRMLRLDITVDERLKAVEHTEAFLQKLVRAKKESPTDDLLSDLAERPDLTDDELTGIGFLLLVAGHETTANMLGLGTFALLENPEQLAALRAEPSLMAGAVEELLRYLSIIHLGPTRTASEDIELEGRLIKAGDAVTISIPAANRDGERFSDPDGLDVRRHATGHLSFGHGVHQCLGQQLARIEMRIGLDGLLNRFPTLALAVEPEAVPMRADMGIYGVHELPVTWRKE